MSDEKVVITIVYHPNSLEGFRVNGNVLTKIGVGRLKSPGQPGGNQMYHSQVDFIRAAGKQRRFPVYHRVGETDTYMGEYSLDCIYKRHSFEGFTYFSYTLRRQVWP